MIALTDKQSKIDYLGIEVDSVSNDWLDQIIGEAEWIESTYVNKKYDYILKSDYSIYAPENSTIVDATLNIVVYQVIDTPDMWLVV